MTAWLARNSSEGIAFDTCNAIGLEGVEGGGGVREGGGGGVGVSGLEKGVEGGGVREGGGGQG